MWLHIDTKLDHQREVQFIDLQGNPISSKFRIDIEFVVCKVLRPTKTNYSNWWNSSEPLQLVISHPAGYSVQEVLKGFQCEIRDRRNHSIPLEIIFFKTQKVIISH